MKKAAETTDSDDTQTVPAAPKVNLPWQVFADLIRGYAHELRNYLATIDLEMTVLEANSPASSESLANIRRALQSSLSQIDRITNLAQIPTPNLLPLKFAELVELWRLKLPPGTTLTFNAEPTLDRAVLESDPTLLPDALAMLAGQPGSWVVTLRFEADQLQIVFPGQTVSVTPANVSERLAHALQEIESIRAQYVIFHHQGTCTRTLVAGKPGWQITLPIQA